MSGRLGTFARTLAITSTLLSALWLPTVAQALPSYSNLYVFGDSLADSGNNALAFDSLPNVVPGTLRTSTPTVPYSVPNYPYASDRYSNGPVWVEYLAADLGLSAFPSLAGGTNYAFGGARVGPSGSGFPYSLADQVSSYLSAAGNVASASALYVVEGGGNDARDIILAPAGSDFAALIGGYAANVANIITRLKLAGAHDILLWNVPDVSKVPAIRAMAGDDPVVLGNASALVAAMNAALDRALASLPTPWLDGLHLFDAYGAFNDLFADPLAYGFDDVRSTCSSDANCVNDPDGVFFWDGLHPTTAGHALLARLAAARIPEPGSVGLLLIALLLLVAGRHPALRVRR